MFDNLDTDAPLRITMTSGENWTFPAGWKAKPEVAGVYFEGRPCVGPSSGVVRLNVANIESITQPTE